MRLSLKKANSSAALPQSNQRVLCAAAIGMFCLGALVYLFDRSGADIYFVPEWWTPADGTPELFGALGGSLPSFAHTYCFSLVFCVLLTPWSIAPRNICIGWCGVEALLELAQHELIASRALVWIPGWFGEWPVLGNLTFYFSRGRFDPADLFAILLGGLAAMTTVELLSRYSKDHNDANK